MISLTDFLFVGAGLFCVGIYMVLSKANAIQVLIGIELMLNAAILNLVAFGCYDRYANSGQIFALFAIVLAIILNVYKRYRTIDPGKIDNLKE
jgi:NADH:ubiquinone oxidoreductase subunit K